MEGRTLHELRVSSLKYVGRRIAEIPRCTVEEQTQTEATDRGRCQRAFPGGPSRARKSWGPGDSRNGCASIRRPTTASCKGSCHAARSGAADTRLRDRPGYEGCGRPMAVASAPTIGQLRRWPHRDRSRSEPPDRKIRVTKLILSSWYFCLLQAALGRNILNALVHAPCQPKARAVAIQISNARQLAATCHPPPNQTTVVACASNRLKVSTAHCWSLRRASRGG